MISDLQLENYESHQKTKLKFSPGITVITGVTDAGKSAIRRSIEWICINRPMGGEFISWGKNKATVTLDGVIKYRYKTNVYELKDYKYKAFGTEVPAPVYNHLKMTEYNFQRQHNPYFLLNDSPGQVARTLNKVAELTLIDKALKEGKRRLSKTKGRVELVEEQRQEKLDEAKKLTWSVQAYIEVEKVKELQFAITVIESAEKTLSEGLSVALTLQEKLNRYPDIDFDISLLIQTERGLNTMKKDLLEHTINSVHQAKRNELKDVPMDLEAVIDLISRLSEGIMPELAKGVTLGRICIEELKGLKNVPEDLNQLTSFETQIDASNNVVSNIEDILRLNKECTEINNKFQESKKKFETELKRLGICPLCSQETK